MPKRKDLSNFKTRLSIPEQKLDEVMFESGDVIADRYEVIKPLGIGGMGVVYLVKDRYLENHLKALKVILPQLLSEKEAKERFRKEVLISQNLNHNNIIRTFDLGIFKSIMFFTMEYIQGQNLRSWLEQKKEAIDLYTTVNIVGAILEALKAAHETTIHCDIKPDNILLGKEGPQIKLKICDFGLSKLQTQTTVFYKSQIMGTFDYMAPEQRSGVRVDKRADLYSVGVLCYELLTGKLPVGRFKPITNWRSDLPSQLDEFINKALEADPEERYQNSGEMKEALLAILHFSNKPQKSWKKKLALFTVLFAIFVYFWSNQLSLIKLISTFSKTHLNQKSSFVSKNKSISFSLSTSASVNKSIVVSKKSKSILESSKSALTSKSSSKSILASKNKKSSIKKSEKPKSEFCIFFLKLIAQAKKQKGFPAIRKKLIREDKNYKTHETALTFPGFLGKIFVAKKGMASCCVYNIYDKQTTNINKGREKYTQLAKEIEICLGQNWNFLRKKNTQDAGEEFVAKAQDVVVSLILSDNRHGNNVAVQLWIYEKRK